MPYVCHSLSTFTTVVIANANGTERDVGIGLHSKQLSEPHNKLPPGALLLTSPLVWNVSYDDFTQSLQAVSYKSSYLSTCKRLL